MTEMKCLILRQNLRRIAPVIPAYVLPELLPIRRPPCWVSQGNLAWKGSSASQTYHRKPTVPSLRQELITDSDDITDFLNHIFCILGERELRMNAVR